MFIGKFKPLIEPLQMWLLKSGRCVGCGKELAKSAKITKSRKQELHTCECSRVYLLGSNKEYRRALLSDLP